MTFLVFQLHSQIFVKHDASGTRDGSSWENAFTDLDAAINSSTINDQIWVAAGTYKPGGAAPADTAFFSFPHDLALYGGFAGTETMLSERDWVVNETILSGDHNGDDIDNDFDNNRSDNSNHVIWLTDTITTATIIDGLIIKNGNTLPASGSGNERRGGGILSLGSPRVNHCVFEQNFGHFGAGFHARNGGASDFLLDSCTFRNNRSFNGAGVFNSSGFGSVTNCTFEFNEAANRGGSVFNNSSGGTYANCIFNNNIAGIDAGAIFINNGGENPEPINISNCEFNDNSSSDWTGAIAIFGSFTTANLTDCEFDGNSCSVNGGALLLGFQSSTNLSNCTFSNNTAPTGRGGAIHVINQNTKLNIHNCSYTSNSAGIGGAISNGGSVDLSDSIPLIQITINDSYFFGNTSIAQGGAINTINTHLSMTNSVVENNFVINSDGVGGGLIFNSIDSVHSEYSLINCTIGNNEAAIGAGIAHWREGSDGSSILTLQNTVLQNPFALNYQIEEGEPTLISNGGNLSSDFSMQAELIDTNDLNDMDPLFVDSDDNNFRLQDDSPCIDAGIADGAPLMDIEGNERLGEVDMGAYENQTPSSIKTLVQLFGELNIFPNPVVKELNFQFKDQSNSRLSVQILDAKGNLISTQYLEKSSEILEHMFDVENLSQGIYFLNISNGAKVNTKPFFKK